MDTEAHGSDMAPRANWKGFLKVGDLACPVALHAAVRTKDRIAFHTLNRRTGNRVQRVFVDSVTGTAVDHDDQVRGYEIAPGEHVVLTPGEVALAVPDSDKTLSVASFVPCGEIDTLYLDKPYYLIPSDEGGARSLALIRDGMRGRKVAALARTVLFRRVRTVLIRAHGDGLMATTLNFDHEVRSPRAVFDDLPDIPVDAAMLDLARRVVKARLGRFEPRDFEDRYESALTDLVKARAEGRWPEPLPQVQPEPVADLLDALRESARAGGRKPRRGADSQTRGTAGISSRRARKAG